ncbi:MAG: YheU family protein [Desulfobacterales bacterium]|nr:YheU family protein [Desulfobacterales bacterium]
MVVPPDRLSPQALQGLIEEYVSRDGTDTGYTKLGIEERVAQVMRQIRKGTSMIVFDEKSRTANILSAEDLKR